jgi:hypothetical protein
VARADRGVLDEGGGTLRDAIQNILRDPKDLQ